jgi:outer membrane protein OmpA-like peptidoglycan-associated protein
MGDGTTLIFSSYKESGKGGYDLFQSRLKYGRWTKPVPLDFINTPKDDELVSAPNSGDILYFSGQSNGKEDIYKIEIPKNLRPEQVISFQGIVKNEKNEAVSAKIQINSLKTGQKVAETENDPETGEFKVLLQKHEKYDIAVTAKGHTFQSEVINTAQLTSDKAITQTISLKPLKKETSFTLNNIFFEFDSDSLNKDSYFELSRVVELLKVNPTLKVEISAHTDDKGSDEYNDGLSQRRAESVVRFLTEKGITTTRTVAKGYGKRSPAFPNDSEENRAKNRRVEFKILEI